VTALVEWAEQAWPPSVTAIERGSKFLLTLWPPRTQFRRLAG
jgi:hypothetical protein